MIKKYYLYKSAFVCGLILSIAACKPDDIISNDECESLNQGFLKIINNYQEDIRVYLGGGQSYVSVPANEIHLYTAATGTLNYKVTDGIGVVLDQAQLFIANNCDTVTISKTSGGGGGGGGGNACVAGMWGSIKVKNTYNEDIRVYMNQSSSYTLMVPAGQTRYLYNMSIGPHKYYITDNIGVVLDKAQVAVNAACDSTIISYNVPVGNSTLSAAGCSTGWGLIRVSNIYSENIRVYFNGSSSYDMYIPAGQSRFYFSATEGKHTYSITDDIGVVLDKAQVYINQACDTAVAGPLSGTGAIGTLSGCMQGNGWGILKVVNQKTESVRVYLNGSSLYTMLLPASSTRYYVVNTGSTGYRITDNIGVTLDQAQINVAQDCDMALITVN